MAGWSMLTNGSLDCADIINGSKGSACCPDVNHAVKDGNASDDDYEVKLRCLFDQVLSAFSIEIAVTREYSRPLPALLGNGQSLDLFKLFQVVRKRGGFDLVNGFWTFIVKELGLDLGASASVKLVYFKYLYELERWLRRSFRDGKLRNGQCQPDGNFSCLSRELEMEFRSLLSHGYQKGKNGKYKKNGKNIIIDSVNSKIGILDNKDAHRACNGVGNRHTDNDEKFDDHKENYSNNNDDDDCVILDPIIAKKIFNSRKRKRESLSRMLNWVIQIAKCPDDPSIGERPSPSKWKDHKGSEIWVQVIRARDALLRRRQVDSNSEQSLLQNNQKMHPSMYEDFTPLSDQSAERLRCSNRLPALAKSRFCSCCSSRSAPQSRLITPPKTELEHDQLPVAADDSSAAKTSLNTRGDEHIQKPVSVGPHFQADVPDWTGMASESDPKWLGMQVWPLEYGNHNALVQTVAIGKGRPDLCDCLLPGSVECIRFHIAENRMKLKLELGSVFYRWRFDCMGEEVSLRWTAQEEKRFKDMVRFNPPSLDKCFWDVSRKCFPRKTRDELVSYYFNVFLIQRRSYQNRVTPKLIDSDDDESEFGSLSDSYGHKAVKVVGTNMLICSENKQCTDFK